MRMDEGCDEEESCVVPAFRINSLTLFNGEIGEVVGVGHIS